MHDSDSGRRPGICVSCLRSLYSVDPWLLGDQNSPGVMVVLEDTKIFGVPMVLRLLCDQKSPGLFGISMALRTRGAQGH